MTKILYLLIEERTRELRSRALIAQNALSLGFDVVIGQQWEIIANLERAWPGVVLFKGNNAPQIRAMRRAKRAGHLVATIEEEAYAIADPDILLLGYADGFDEVCDLHLTQGSFQHEVVTEKFPNMRGRMTLTGNPRRDLLEIPLSNPILDEGRRMRERHGHYILVNTNYGTINNREGDALWCHEHYCNTGFRKRDDPEDLEDFLDNCAWERLNLRTIAGFTRGLARRRSDIRIVLRPHPVEKADPWRDAFQDVSNVTVEPSGDHLHWIAGSALVVHTSSTTGLEAFLLDTPAVSLTPGTSRWPSTWVCNVVNPTFQTSRDATKVALDLIAGQRFDLGGDRQTVSEHLYRPANSSSALAIANSLNELCETMPIGARSGRPIWNRSMDRQMSERQSQKARFSGSDLKTIMSEFSQNAYVRLPGTMEELGDAVYLLKPEHGVARQ